MRILRALLVLLAFILVIVSFVPLVETNAWLVRMADFPRLQLLVALVALVVLIVVTWRGLKLEAFGVLVFVVAAIAYHAVKLWPYVPDDVARSCPAGARFEVLVANVQLGNRASGRLIDLVRGRAPDVFIAMETDEWWDEQLSVLADTMPHEAQHITGSYFGIHLFSRKPLSSPTVLFPVNQDTPAISARIVLDSGREVGLLAVHPSPPHPSQPSTGRDAQLMWAALQARAAAKATPMVVAGDLNAVPWERTVERMQRIGGLIDPRQRLGFKATYDARSWWMHWPLDHVLHTDDLRALDADVLPAFGSDHFPYAVSLCDQGSEIAPPALLPDDIAEAQRTLNAAREGRPERAGR